MTGHVWSKDPLDQTTLSEITGKQTKGRADVLTVPACQVRVASMWFSRADSCVFLLFPFFFFQMKFHVSTEVVCVIIAPG